MLSSAFIPMILSNLKSMVTTLMNGIAMCIPFVQESHANFKFPDANVSVRTLSSDNRMVTPDDLSDPRKFLPMVYLEIDIIH